MAGMTDSGSGRRGSRAATLRRRLLVVLGVVLLALVVDAGARAGAERSAAGRIQATAALEARPDVRIRGLTFLPQLLRGRYSRVGISLDDFTQEGLRLSRVHVDLVDVTVPVDELVSGTANRVLVDRTAGQARISYEDLNRFLQQDGQPFTVSAGAAGGAHVQGTVTVAGNPVQVGGDVTLAVEDGKIQVRPRLGALLEDVAPDEPLTITLSLPDLPYGQRLSDVGVSPEGIEIEVVGDHVVIER